MSPLHFSYMEKIMINNFYCYSKKLSHFIRAFDISYISIGIHPITNVKYYVFTKSKKLDKIIALYNEVKHKY